MTLKLWEVNHPYHNEPGCYGVDPDLGYGFFAGGHWRYDGNTCHTNYASWGDFKAGVAMPFTATQLQRRAAHGIDDKDLEEQSERWQRLTGGSGYFEADQDYNLLYRWDWYSPHPDEFDDNYEGPRGPRLDLFYMQQRKGRSVSVSVHNLTHSDEPEVREWLQAHWRHMQRLWMPLSTCG